MKWFKHDSNANTDAKMKKLRHKYGIVAYGLYWYCVELISGRVSKENISFELEEDAEIIALEWKMDQLKVQEMMEYMCKIGLFSNNNGVIKCLKLAKRLDDTNAKNPEIKQILNQINLDDSELVGETPNDSDQIRLDKTRLEDKNNTSESKIPHCPHEKIIDLYHEVLPALPCVTKSLWKTSVRAKNLQSRWKQSDQFQKIEFWQWLFESLGESSFHMGENDRGWKADLGWIVKRSNFEKLVEKFLNA